MGMLSRSTLVVAALVALPAGATAQLCLGVPAPAGTAALAARAGVAWGETTYDGSATVNLAGPLSVTGAYAHGMLYPLHRPANGIAGSVAYELSPWGMSVCPTVEAQHERLSTTRYRSAHSLSWTTVSMGVNVGRTVATLDESYLIAHGGPRVFYFHRVYRSELPEAPAGSPASSAADIRDYVEVGGQAGLTIGRGRFYLDASVAGTSHGSWEPAYTFSLGVVLGGEGS
jgi:hypothetical protein